MQRLRTEEIIARNAFYVSCVIFVQILQFVNLMTKSISWCYCPDFITAGYVWGIMPVGGFDCGG